MIHVSYQNERVERELLLFCSAIHKCFCHRNSWDGIVIASVNLQKCDLCRHFGANLGCLQHGCSQRAHYKCALESGWYLNEDLFKSSCSLHPMKEVMN